MDVVAVSLLPTTSLVWQPKPGAWTFTVICKATYVLAPGESPLAEEQDPPNEADGHWDDDPSRSLCFASDLAPVKTHAEVTLVGHAYAPENRPVRSLIARLAVGEVDRSIEVWTDRAKTTDGVVQEAAPFTHMALVYERARGGPDTWNPAGIPPGLRDAHGRVILPNLQAPGAGPDAIDPVGWGPIAPSWPGRLSKLGRRPMPDVRELAGTPLPWGFDLGFFNSAPPDQRLRSLRDNERIVLENLHPDHPRLSTRLPGVRPRAYVDRGGAAPSPVTMRADTLAIDTDRCVCTVTFRGHFPIARPDERGRVLVDMERGTEHRSWAEVQKAAAARRGDPAQGHRDSLPSIELDEQSVSEEYVSTTMAESDAREVLGDTLPFAKPVRAFLDARAHARAQRPAQDLPFVAPPAPGTPPPPAPPAPPPPMIPPPRASSPSLSGASGATPPAPPISVPAPPPSRVSTVPGTIVPMGSGVASPAVVGAVPSPPGPGAQGAIPPPPPPVPAGGLPPPPPVPGSPGAPILRSLPGGDSPWAGGAPSLAEPARGTIGTLAAAQTGAQSEVAAIKDTGAPNAVLRASNAAAGKSAVEPLAPEIKRAPTATPPASSASPGETGKVIPIPSLEVVDLVWFERGALPRIRKNPAWRAIVQALEDRPPDPDLDDATLGATPAEVEDRRDVFEVLTRGTATDGAGIEEALSSAVRTDGKVVPPFVLAAGDLSFPFDEVEVLKAHVAIISPLAAGDEKLKSEIALVRDFLANPELACAPPMVDALSNRLWEAFGKNKRAVPAETLKSHSDSVLLQKRRFQKREVFGGNHLRALLHAGQGGGPFPAYLPAGLAAVLPMYQRFRARLFAEVHLGVDQHESCPTALRVVAVARVVERVRRLPAATATGPAPEPVNPRDSRPG